MNNTKTTSDKAHSVLNGSSGKGKISGILPFLGPAFIAGVAYVDPGNFATNIQGGAKFGYTLIWVIIAGNMMAFLIQLLSAKLGIATGKNLAEHCRDSFSKPVVIMMWILMEIVVMATDLAEFIGAAVGFNLLFGIPIIPAGIITAFVTFFILGLQKYGFRSIEVIISGFVGVISICYLFELILARPDWGGVVYHTVMPRFEGSESVFLAAGILGATVMPHAIYLHSALTQGRVIVRDEKRLKRLYCFEFLDVLIAMLLAGFVNAAMLIMSAATFFQNNMRDVGTLEQAHRTLEPLLGAAAGIVFAVSLLASGLSSSSVGTMAGQVIMKGFVHYRIPVWFRRLITMLPSLIVISLGFEPTRVLVLSQVILSFGLPFAIIPLVIFTSDKKKMGFLVNNRLTAVTAGFVALLIVMLNVYLIYVLLSGG